MYLDFFNIDQLNISDQTKYNNQYGFIYRAMTTGLEVKEQREQLNTLSHNAIFFLLDGALQISLDNNNFTTIKAGELYFLPRGANVTANIVGREVKYIAARLDLDLNNRVIYDKFLEEVDKNSSHSFSPYPIKKPLDIFLKSMEQYLIDGIEELQLQNTKMIELYIIFKAYYTEEECVGLFYPIVENSSTFKLFVLDNYNVLLSIDELAEKANMSRSTFDRKFKEDFGMTPLKWIEIQTRILILRKAAEPNVSVKDIMYEVGVHNSSQFTKLCKRLCGATPSHLIQT